MAEYFFYGTKGGLTSLSSKTTHFSQPFDIRNNNQVMDLLGKCFYSLSFTPDGCIFSKYTFLIDAPRSNGFGFLGVDVFVPSAKKIQSIKELLDELIGGYVSLYVKDNGINKNEPGIMVKEDYSFADNLLLKHKEENRLVPEESFASGGGDASYLLYNNSDDELNKLLNEPFRSEYKDYKRVFLIDTNLKDQGILKVIKYDSNANLTGRVDLKNLLYKVEECSTSKCDKSILHRNDSLSITWTEKFCDSRTEAGSLNDLVSKKVVEIDEESRVVKILPVSLSKVTKDIRVSVVDYNGKVIKEASLSYGRRFEKEKKTISGGVVTLVGEEVERISEFYVYVEGLNSEYKMDKKGYQMKDSETTIRLDREKNVSVNFTIPEIVFQNGELDKQVSVNVTAKVGDRKYEYNTFCPVEKLKDNIKLQESRKINEEEKQKENGEKKVDMRWLIVSIISGLILSIGLFFLADYLDFNIFNSHGHGKIEKIQKPDYSSNGESQSEVDERSQSEGNGGSQSESNGVKIENKTENKSNANGDSKTNTNTSSDAKKTSSVGSDNLSKLLGKSILKCKQSDLKNDKVKENSAAKLLLDLWNIDSPEKMQDFSINISNCSDLKEVYDEVSRIDVVTFPKAMRGKENKSIEDLINDMKKNENFGF